MAKKISDIIKELGQGKDDTTFPSLNDPISKELNRVIKKLQANLIKFKHNASNALSQSINPLPTKLIGTKYEIGIVAEDYATDVDKGTRPKGFTKEKRNALQPKILQWIGAKKGFSDRKKQRSISFAIATNILKKGTIKRFGYKGSNWISSEEAPFKKNLTEAIINSLK